MQRHVRRTWNVDPPGHKSILKWDKTLWETGSLLPQTGKHAKVSVNEETIERVRTEFARSPRKSIRRASTEHQIPRSTIHKIIHKRLQLCAFKIQLRHHIRPNDRPLRAHFETEMLLRIENDNSYLATLFSRMKQPFFYAAKSISPTAGYGVQRIPMLFTIMRETRLKWMSGMDWRGTQSLDHSSS